MYSDDDLNDAVEAGILPAETVSQFRQYIDQQRQLPTSDQENFKLIRSFNDIFVSIACVLVMMSILWLLHKHEVIACVVTACVAWLLAEIFIRKRRMALPAIILLSAFLWSVAGATLMAIMHVYLNGSIDNLPETPEWLAIGTALIVVCAALLHWLRFRVAMTVALGCGALILAIWIFTPGTLDLSSPVVLAKILLSGVACFAFGLFWDAQDRERISYHSDVAFWIHLMAAPLIVHPTIQLLDAMGSTGLGYTLCVLALYLLLTFISIVVDRRVFMVSALIYVIIALAQLFDNPDGASTHLAATGAIVGTLLLALSAYWQTVRAVALQVVPAPIKRWVPAAIPEHKQLNQQQAQA